MDMHSGGGTKEEPFEYIYIEAPQKEAEVVFYNRFGHNPNRVSCTCCGEDYSISESDSIEQATAYERGCDYAYFRPDGTECTKEEGWKIGKGLVDGYSSRYVERPNQYGRYQTLEDYIKRKDILFIREQDIKPEERKGTVPYQGYVWVD